jgi:hypothetical protein
MITLVYGEDWIGIYRDGKLIVQGHQFSECEVLEALGYEYESVNANGKWLCERGNLPKSLDDVKVATGPDDFYYGEW